MISLILVVFTATLLISTCYSKLLIDYQVLQDVFGAAPQASVSQAVETHVQAAATTPVPKIENTSDVYYETDDFNTTSIDYDKFDWTLTKRVASSSRYNFLVSPLGLKLSLASLADAATNETRTQLLSALGLDKNRTVNFYKYSTISNTLKKKSSEFIRNLSNWIFVPDDLVPRQKAVATAEYVYNTEIRTVNKNDPFEAATMIRSWVMNDTQGKIVDAFNEYDVSKMSILVLNTLYFKNSWRIQTNDTNVEYFYVSPTTHKYFRFMHVLDSFGYAESSKLDAKILMMPYVAHFSLYFIVPNSLMGLSHVLDNLGILSTELESVTAMYVDVTLPRFYIDYTSELSGILKELGVHATFQATASFPGIGRNTLPHDRIKITKVMQRFNFGVTELGSDIYDDKDFTGTRQTTSPVNTRSTVEVVANRPFLFLLYDETTQAFLLIGRVSDPTVPQGYFEVVLDA